MDKKTYKKWKNLTDKTLNNSREFRNLCGRPFDRGFIGELLVIKQLLKTYKAGLCSFPENNFIYAGSANKKWDIELKLNGKIIQINAKATTQSDKNGPHWVRQKASTFCDIKINSKSLQQRVSLKTDYDPNLFYVFVDVGTWLKKRTTQFFTLSDKKAKLIFGQKYSKYFNKQKRKSPTDDFGIDYKDIKTFEDRNLKSIQP